MTRMLKALLAAVYAVWSVVEIAWMKTETMMYLASAPVWFSFFEMSDRKGSWLQWLWLAIAMVQLIGLIAAPVFALLRRYKPFLILLGGQLVIRLIWLLRATETFRVHFALALVLHAAVFAGAVYAFTRRDMDAD